MLNSNDWVLEEIENPKNCRYIVMKTIILVLALSFFPVTAYAVTYEQILEHKASTSRPFWGDVYKYKNIEWISHKIYFEGVSEKRLKEIEQEMLEAVDERGQIDVGKVDLNGDGRPEYLKVIWTAYGGPAKGLIIEPYDDEALKNRIGLAEPRTEGYHPNFKIEDVDKDGVLELITFVGIHDPKLPYLSDGDKPFEARFSDRYLEVRIYKYKNGTFRLSRKYTTKKKYEPHYLPKGDGLPE